MILTPRQLLARNRSCHQLEAGQLQPSNQAGCWYPDAPGIQRVKCCPVTVSPGRSCPANEVTVVPLVPVIASTEVSAWNAAPAMPLHTDSTHPHHQTDGTGCVRTGRPPQGSTWRTVHGLQPRTVHQRRLNSPAKNRTCGNSCCSVVNRGATRVLLCHVGRTGMDTSVLRQPRSTQAQDENVRPCGRKAHLLRRNLRRPKGFLEEAAASSGAV